MATFKFPWYLLTEKRADVTAPSHWYDVDLTDATEDLILEKVAMVIAKAAGNVTFQGVGDDRDQTKEFAANNYISPNGCYPGGWIKKISLTSEVKEFTIVVYKGK